MKNEPVRWRALKGLEDVESEGIMIKTQGCVFCVIVMSVFASQAQAQISMGKLAPLELAQNSQMQRAVPADNTIRRINPNSRQGSISSTPPVRGPSTLPTFKMPTIENGEVGNGYPRPSSTPQTLRPTAPSLQRGTQR